MAETSVWCVSCARGVSAAPRQALHGVAVVADDILVYGIGKKMEEARFNHDANLLQLLDRAREQHLKLNKDKMRLHLTEVLYIGHVISAIGIQPDPSNMWYAGAERTS